MGRRGRKSADELATKALLNPPSSAINQPEPPDTLWRDEEQAEWRRIVESLPADWFSAASEPLLAQYVRHIVSARRVAQLLRQMEHGPGDLDLAAWLRLMRAQDAQSAIIASLATKMRIAQQSTYGTRAAHTAKANASTGKRPWEF